VYCRLFPLTVVGAGLVCFGLFFPGIVVIVGWCYPSFFDCCTPGLFVVWFAGVVGSTSVVDDFLGVL
jgi:hypothetical protein